MNKEQDYASDTDESDDDFRPEDLSVESPPSEDDSDEDEGLDEELKKKPLLKGANKRVKRNRKLQHEESDDENTNTSRRSTRQNGDQTNGKGTNLEKDELSDEEDKSHTKALWADFLKDVNHKETLSRINPSKAENKPSSSGLNGKEASVKKADEVKPNLSLTQKVEENKIVVTEVLDFAGEEISIQREVDTSSIKENKAATIQAAKKQPFSRIMPGVGMKRFAPTTTTGSAPGLGSILNQLGKKKKLSVLEKSQMDWKCFKQSEGIDEQLQTFNKGKDGYLERQDFLQRTDLRQFEIEKNLRQTSRRPH